MGGNFSSLPQKSCGIFLKTQETFLLDSSMLKSVNIFTNKNLLTKKQGQNREFQVSTLVAITYFGGLSLEHCQCI
jgi:hypothetical protein